MEFSLVAPGSWHVALASPRDWLDQCKYSWGRWMDPGKASRQNFFSELWKLAGSKLPADQARHEELMREGKEWQARLLARYPELAPRYHEVPDERNALLRLKELSAQLGDQDFSVPDELALSRYFS